MIVLASSSPRRRELLGRLGVEFVVDAPEIDEQLVPGEPPEKAAVRLAREKALAVAARYPDDPVLAADTLVVLSGRILGKPDSAADAEAMLAHMTGRVHRVLTGVALVYRDHIADRCDATRVWMRQLSHGQIRRYVETGEPLDKAGSYGVQGQGGLLVERIEGDFFGVMGFPLRLVVDLLEAAGVPYCLTR
jgi:septum formation protein